MSQKQLAKFKPEGFVPEHVVDVYYKYKAETWPIYFFSIIFGFAILGELAVRETLSAFLFAAAFGFLLFLFIVSRKRDGEGACELSQEGIWIDRAKTYIPWPLVRDIRQQQGQVYITGVSAQLDSFTLYVCVTENEIKNYRVCGLPAKWFAKKIDEHSYLMKINMPFTQGQTNMSMSKEDLWSLLHIYTGIPSKVLY
ncbi:MAG: hypothetical protein ACTHPO_10455 [Alphaproteobacteria bacterium]